MSVGQYVGMSNGYCLAKKFGHTWGFKIGPLGLLHKKLEKDNIVNDKEVLRLLRTVGMDGFWD